MKSNNPLYNHGFAQDLEDETIALCLSSTEDCKLFDFRLSYSQAKRLYENMGSCLEKVKTKIDERLKQEQQASQYSLGNPIP